VIFSFKGIPAVGMSFPLLHIQSAGGKKGQSSFVGEQKSFSLIFKIFPDLRGGERKKKTSDLESCLPPKRSALTRRGRRRAQIIVGRGKKGRRMHPLEGREDIPPALFRGKTPTFLEKKRNLLSGVQKMMTNINSRLKWEREKGDQGHSVGEGKRWLLRYPGAAFC